MRILITGAAGFLGSHMCDRLLAEGHDVIGVDNLLTGNIDNLDSVSNNRRFEFIEHDVTKPLQVKGALDGVMHLASPASPVDYLELPFETLLVGSMGTHLTLDIAREKGARYLLASTSEVYGDPAEHPQREEYWGNVNSVGPRAVYDEAKRYAEAVTSAYRRYHNVDTHIVRIFNTYGPRMRPNDGRVVSNFIVQALRGDALTVYGEGTQTRSFCYVTDEIEGLYRLFMSDEPGPVNIGNPDEFTVRELATLVLRLTGSSSTIDVRPLPTDDPKVRKPDITRARERLGWNPQISLEEGLKLTIPFFRQLVDEKGAAARPLHV